MLLGVVLFSIGIFLLILIHKNKYKETKLYFLLFIALASIFLASYLLFSNISTELILRRTTGLVLGIFGFLLTFMFPSTTDYQPRGMSYTGVFIGIILLIAGIVMMFF